MANKEKTFPYADLGNLLKRWRATRYRSATALCGAAGFSFSYGVYAAYERGEDLAPPVAIEEIAIFLNEDPREGLLAWAQTQMHRPEFKALFSPQTMKLGKRGEAGAGPPIPIHSNQIPPSEFDNTWVFAAPEREQLSKYPWLMEFLIGLAVSYPDEVPFSRYGFESVEYVRILNEKYLNLWIQGERIVVSDTGYRLAQPYIHMPKTEQWQQIRDNLLGRALEAVIPQLHPTMIKDKRSHRTTINKVLSAAQREYWVNRLAEIEMEFSMAPSPSLVDSTAQAHTLLMFLAPRELGLPKHVTRGKKD